MWYYVIKGMELFGNLLWSHNLILFVIYLKTESAEFESALDSRIRICLIVGFVACD